jgi:prophage regulatory protein
MRLRAVEDATGLKHTAIYKKVFEGTFPKPIKIGEKAVAWDEDEVAAWQAERIAARDKAA